MDCPLIKDIHRFGILNLVIVIYLIFGICNLGFTLNIGKINEAAIDFSTPASPSSKRPLSPLGHLPTPD